ncbi:MAG: hypothetical protein NT132_05635 [Microbacterium sp.]|uniref:hypothetical protein n=1 Tax=Microbacterium sp. TaxID=51671 RepID=UPI002615B816|nr:hypothetical protein [Microbacterium sp.]MCX6501877.1 hypothetical protein [Microbacterium sp.]
MTAYPSWTPAPRPGIVPLHPLPFGTILGRSFASLRRNPRVLLGFGVTVQAVAFLILILATGGVSWAAFSRLATVPVGSDDYETVLAGSVAITIIVGLVFTIAATALTVVVQGVVVADVAHGVVAEKLGLRALWQRVRPAIWRLLGYTLLTTLAVLVVLGVVGGGIALIGFSLSGPLGIGVAVVLTLLAALALIPLSLWLSTKLCLVPAVLVLEHATVFGAIARSWRLVRGRFWAALGVIVIVQAAFSVIAQVVSVPFSLLSSILPAVLAPTGDPDVATVIAALGGSVLAQAVTLLVQAVAVIVLATATTLLYVDARMRKEGLDLDLSSYVEQRQAGAGAADPYSWHIGHDRAPTAAPSWPAPPAPTAVVPTPPAPPAPAPPAGDVAPPEPTRWAPPGGSV